MEKKHKQRIGQYWCRNADSKRLRLRKEAQTLRRYPCKLTSYSDSKLRQSRRRGA